jgi:transposase
LDRRISAFDNEFAVRAREDEEARRLATIPGIGVVNATALVTVIGDGQSFAVLHAGAIFLERYQSRMATAAGALQSN